MSEFWDFVNNSSGNRLLWCSIVVMVLAAIIFGSLVDFAKAIFKK